jgi:hypothetical protein
MRLDAEWKTEHFFEVNGLNKLVDISYKNIIGGV